MKKILLALALVAGQAQGAGTEPAIKNFRQIFQSMRVATGISGDSQAISSFWAESQGRLPRNGEVGEVNTPALLTFQSLAALFCKEMIDKDMSLPAAQRQAHRQVDFRLLPTAYSLAVRESVIEEYSAMFLGRSPDAVERILMLESMERLAESLPSVAASTGQYFLLSCTLVGSSVDSLTF